MAKMIAEMEKTRLFVMDLQIIEMWQMSWPTMLQYQPSWSYSDKIEKSVIISLENILSILLSLAIFQKWNSSWSVKWSWVLSWI